MALRKRAKGYGKNGVQGGMWASQHGGSQKNGQSTLVDHSYPPESVCRGTLLSLISPHVHIHGYQGQYIHYFVFHMDPYTTPNPNHFPYGGTSVDSQLVHLNLRRFNLGCDQLLSFFTCKHQPQSPGSQTLCTPANIMLFLTVNKYR